MVAVPSRRYLRNWFDNYTFEEFTDWYRDHPDRFELLVDSPDGVVAILDYLGSFDYPRSLDGIYIASVSDLIWKPFFHPSSIIALMMYDRPIHPRFPEVLDRTELDDGDIQNLLNNVRPGDLPMVTQYLERYGYLGQESIEESILESVRNGNLELVDLFIAIQDNIRLPLRVLSSNLDLETEVEIMDEGEVLTPLAYAVKLKNYQAAEVLLQAGADPGNPRVRDYAIESGQPDLIRLIESYPSRSHPLD